MSNAKSKAIANRKEVQRHNKGLMSPEKYIVERARDKHKNKTFKKRYGMKPGLPESIWPK